MPAPPAATPRGATIDRDAPGGTHLHGRWLLLARAARAALVLLAAGLFLAGLPIYADQLPAVCHGGDCHLGRQLGPAEAQALAGLGLSLDHYAAYQAGLVTAWTGGSVAVAALIGWRVRTGIGLFVALTLALMAAITFSTTPLGERAQPGEAVGRRTSAGGWRAATPSGDRPRGCWRGRRRTTQPPASPGCAHSPHPP